MEQKMLEFMQGQVDEARQCREDGFRDTETWWFNRYLACADMFKRVTGKEVVMKRWVVSVKEEA